MRTFQFQVCLLAAFVKRGASFAPKVLSHRSKQITSSALFHQGTSSSSVNQDTASASLLKQLYPVSSPFNQGDLWVDSIHTLHYEEYGNPEGLPALFLHGGPGAGCNANHARFFDPSKYRIILLDQRGSGQSTPRGEVRQNTLNHLVNDCERIRTHLGIPEWKVVLGGSWGSTLAVAYAQEYPKSVRSLVLRGVCLLRPQEVDWLFGGNGIALQDPKGWRDFQEFVGVTSTSPAPREALHAYYDRLMGTDPVRRLEAARKWMQWEMSVSARSQKLQQSQEQQGLVSPVIVKQGSACAFSDPWGNAIDTDRSPQKYTQRLKKGMMTSTPFLEQHEARPTKQLEPTTSDHVSSEDAAQFVPAQAMLTCYYSVNERFATNNWNPLERVDRVRQIPCIAIHGGADEICPVDTALELFEAWPEMELRIPIKAGHSMYNPSILNELIMATDRLACFHYGQ